MFTSTQITAVRLMAPIWGYGAFIVGIGMALSENKTRPLVIAAWGLAYIVGQRLYIYRQKRHERIR